MSEQQVVAAPIQSEQQVVATSIQIVLNADEIPSNEGLDSQYSIVSTDGKNAGQVLLWTSANHIQNFTTGTSRSYDVVQPVTDLVLGASGKSFEATKAICVFNFGYTTEEARDLEFNSDMSPYADPFGSLPGIICKVVVRNDETNTYGGFYFWDSETAMHDYVDGKDESLLHFGEDKINVKEWLSTREDLMNQSFETYLVKQKYRIEKGGQALTEIKVSALSSLRIRYHG